MEKIDTRTLPIAAVNQRRRQAVKLRLEGLKLKDIARITELSPTTIIAVHKAYLAGGWEAVARRDTKGLSGNATLWGQQFALPVSISDEQLVTAVMEAMKIAGGGTPK